MIVFTVQVFMLGVFVEQWATHAQVHVGCFRSTNIQPILSKTVFIPNHDENTMTIDICIMRCRMERGTTYGGIISGFHCRCGDSHQHEVNGPQLNDSSCATKCPGDPQGNCGGDSSIVIYSVCNQTRYRDITIADGNCDASCHCLNLRTCTYSTGFCPAGCEPGWSSAACNVRDFKSVAGEQTMMTNAVTQSENNGVTDFKSVAGEQTMMTNAGTHSVNTGVTGADQASIDPHTNDDTPVTAIAVGVSVAFVCLVALAALIVYFRKREHTRKFGDAGIETASIPEVSVGAYHDKGDLETEQSDHVPTYVPSVSSSTLNYSTVVFANSSPVCDDGTDIAKSGDDIIIHDNHEKVEYAVVMRPTATDQAILQENTLYGTLSENPDDE